MIGVCHKYTPGAVQITLVITFKIRHIRAVVHRHALEPLHVATHVHRRIPLYPPLHLDLPAILLRRRANLLQRLLHDLLDILGRAGRDAHRKVRPRLLRNDIRRDPAIDPAQIDRRVPVLLATRHLARRLAQRVERLDQQLVRAEPEPGVAGVGGAAARVHAEQDDPLVPADELALGRLAEDDGGVVARVERGRGEVPHPVAGGLLAHDEEEGGSRGRDRGGGEEGAEGYDLSGDGALGVDGAAAADGRVGEIFIGPEGRDL